jgi:acyl dehydratase
MEIVAVNTAKEVENKIHDDTVARKLGFAGGLVPGVNSFGYMMQLPLETLGTDWLDHGFASVKFMKPVYEGETVLAFMEIESERPDALQIWLEGTGGDTRAFGQVRPGRDGIPGEFRFRAPVGEPVNHDERPPLIIGPELEGQALPPITIDFSREVAEQYPGQIGLPSDPVPGLAHPAWLLGCCVRLIRDNFVRPGPSIHAGAELWMLAPARSGQRLVLYGGVSQVYEKRGNQFIQNDIEIRNEADVPVARILNTGIYAFRALQDGGRTA